MTERVCKGCGGELPTMHGNRRYCSDNCRKRRWDRAPENRKRCLNCGTLVWRGERCVPCEHRLRAHEHESLLRHIEKMWNDGLSMRAMATALGRSGSGTVNNEVDELRKAGRIGYRNKAYEEKAA